MTKFAIIFISALTPLTAFSAGSGHASDLIFPAINFITLFGFIAFKMRKSLDESFKNKASDIEAMYKSASEKDKEAELRLKDFRAKVSNISQEVSKLKEDQHKALEKFLIERKNEAEASKHKLRRDNENKIKQEEKLMYSELYQMAIDKVVGGAKKEINDDSAKSKKATQNLLTNL